MNSLIKKFWEHNGVPVHSYKFGNHSNSFGAREPSQFWFLYSDPDYYNQDGPPPPLKEDIVCVRWFNKSEIWCTDYYLRNKKYTEDEMLRIISLKAFI